MTHSWPAPHRWHIRHFNDAHDAAFNAFPIINVSPYRRGRFAWSESHKIFSATLTKTIEAITYIFRYELFMQKNENKTSKWKSCEHEIMARHCLDGWQRLGESNTARGEKLFLLLRLRWRYMAGEGGWDVAEEVARWVFLLLFFPRVAWGWKCRLSFVQGTSCEHESWLRQ